MKRADGEPAKLDSTEVALTRRHAIAPRRVPQTPDIHLDARPKIEVWFLVLLWGLEFGI